MKTNKVYSYILEALESGVVPWRYPYIPMTSGNGHVYKGINRMQLNLRARQAGYSSPYWYTFNNAKKNGGHVMKRPKHLEEGEVWGTPVFYWASGTYKDEETDKERGYAVRKTYWVFNREQCVFPDCYEPDPIDHTMPDAEDLVAKYLYREDIEHRTTPGMAFYNPKDDFINVPHPHVMTDPALYYPTFFHEIGHSTGHTSRLARKGVCKGALYSNHEYSEEELVAEMTAAYLCGETGMEMEHLDQSAAYIQSWLKALDNDMDILQRAATQAEKAYQFILKGKQDEESEEDNDNR